MRVWLATFAERGPTDARDALGFEGPKPQTSKDHQQSLVILFHVGQPLEGFGWPGFGVPPLLRSNMGVWQSQFSARKVGFAKPPFSARKSGFGKLPFSARKREIFGRTKQTKPEPDKADENDA